jgi:hypothetical protein
VHVRCAPHRLGGVRRGDTRERRQSLIDDPHELDRSDAAHRRARVAAANEPRYDQRDGTTAGNVERTDDDRSDDDLVSPVGDGIAEHDAAPGRAVQRQLVQLCHYPGRGLCGPRRRRVLGEQTVALTGPGLPGRSRSGQDARLGKEAGMDKRPYSKPALTTLGLLRKLTQFSF